MRVARLSYSPAEDCAVKGREALFSDFPPLGFGGVHFRSIAELPGAKVLRNGADTGFHVLARQMNLLGVLPNSPQRHMNVRMFGIEVGNGNPVEPSPRSFSILSIKSRVSRVRSTRSPNSGEIITFHKRRSPATCQPSSVAAMSIPWVLRSNPAAVGSVAALSRAT